MVEFLCLRLKFWSFLITPRIVHSLTIDGLLQGRFAMHSFVMFIFVLLGSAMQNEFMIYPSGERDTHCRKSDSNTQAGLFVGGKLQNKAHIS